MKCDVCGTEFELEEIIDWSHIQDYEIYSQESACPECGISIWIPSWEIEKLLEVSE